MDVIKHSVSSRYHSNNLGKLNCEKGGKFPPFFLCGTEYNLRLLDEPNQLVKHTMLNFRLYFAFLLIAPLFLYLSGCSGLDIKPPEPEKKPISVLTGKPQGTTVEELFKEKNKTGGLPVNALLWRAALDIASFVPLADVDTFGGSIVTEWYVPEGQPNRRLKLAIFVVGLELRSDAIQVHAYVQTRDDNTWTSAGRDSALGRKLEDLILTRARELRAAAVSETSN